jgi:chromosome segregation ATPase
MRGQAGAGPQPFGEIIGLTMAAQQRSLDLAQAWSENLLGLLRDQAEGNQAVLAALASSLTAMERALASQEETNRALRQTLDAHREVVEQAAAAQARGVRLVQDALDGLAATATAQLEAMRGLMGSATPGQEPFGDLMQAWTASWQRLLEAGLPPSAREERG